MSTIQIAILSDISRVWNPCRCCDRPATGTGSGTALWRKLVRSCALFGAVFVVSLLPTFVTRQIIYGSPFETGYPGMRTWHWTSPALLEVLFSSDHGMFSWTPILILAAVGLFFLIKRNVLLGVGSLLTFLAYYYFIASYPDWDGLSSYGNRFFVSLTPIFILGLAALFSSFASWIGKASRAAIVATDACGLVHGMEYGVYLSVGHAYGSRARANFMG